MPSSPLLEWMPTATAARSSASRRPASVSVEVGRRRWMVSATSGSRLLLERRRPAGRWPEAQAAAPPRRRGTSARTRPSPSAGSTTRSVPTASAMLSANRRRSSSSVLMECRMRLAFCIVLPTSSGWTLMNSRFANRWRWPCAGAMEKATTSAATRCGAARRRSSTASTTSEVDEEPDRAVQQRRGRPSAGRRRWTGAGSPPRP